MLDNIIVDHYIGFGCIHTYNKCTFQLAYVDKEQAMSCNLIDKCLICKFVFFDFFRDKSNTPSGFTLKLRKHIRTRRLEDVRQLGYDRVYTVYDLTCTCTCTSLIIIG